MYLTRCTLDPARRGARRLLASPQVMHAAVRAAFAAHEDYERPGARALWRVDTNADSTVHLYIVSPGAPPDEIVAATAADAVAACAAGHAVIAGPTAAGVGTAAHAERIVACAAAAVVGTSAAPHAVGGGRHVVPLGHGLRLAGP